MYAYVFCRLLRKLLREIYVYDSIGGGFLYRVGISVIVRIILVGCSIVT
jgi:hypothetical protein